MASSIDATKPTAGAALTADVRNNFSAAKTEIEALQAADATLAPKASPTFTGTVTLPAGQVVNGVTLSTAQGTSNFLRGDGTYAAPAGGSPAGSGSELQYRNAGAFGAVTGSSVSGGAVTLVDTLTSALGSIAASKPARSDTATWTGGGTYVHEFTNITDTSSAAGSLLREWQVGGVQVAAIRKDGSLQWGSASNRIVYQFGSQISFDVGGQTRMAINANGLDVGAANDIYLRRSAAGVAEFNNGTLGTFRDIKARSYLVDATNTAAGTTGARTINKAAGTVNFAAAATSLVVTNSLVTTSSLVFCTIRTNDATAVIKNVVPAAGSFTINLNAAATAETSVGFYVIN